MVSKIKSSTITSIVPNSSTKLPTGNVKLGARTVPVSFGESTMSFALFNILDPLGNVKLPS